MSTVVALAAVPCIAIAGLAALLMVPVNLQLTVTDTMLVLEPHGPDVWWTRRQRIEVPLADIVSIRIAPRSEAPALGARCGVHVDGVITAGVFGTGDERVFWDVRRGDALLIISCRPGSAFSALVVQFADPVATLTRTRTVRPGVTV